MLPLYDWEEESGLFLNIGRKLKDHENGYTLEVIGFSGDPEGIQVKRLLSYSMKEASSFIILYSELLQGFQNEILEIEGFCAGQVRELKTAIASVKSKLEHTALSSRVQELSSFQEQVLAEKAEQQRIAEEAEAARILAEEEAEKQRIIAEEQAKQEAARLKAEQEAEAKRLKEEEEAKKPKFDAETLLAELQLNKESRVKA